MSNISEPRKTIPVSKGFFCDGPYYLLTSASLGGSDLTPEALSDVLTRAEQEEIEELLKRGVCIPLFFDGDCALDGNTVFVLGSLTEQEEHDWIGRVSWKLNIPCGKFTILCGGGEADDLVNAISGNPPPENFEFFQVIEVPPGEYLVEVYAYLSSMTVQVALSKFDENGNLKEDEALRQWYEANRPGLPDIGYIIRLAPLETEPLLPELVPDVGWCGKFEFRQPEL